LLYGTGTLLKALPFGAVSASAFASAFASGLSLPAARIEQLAAP